MSMPQIPEEKYRPSLCEVTIDLLKSVALEETALAHIINAEGERCQALARRFESCCDDFAFEKLEESIKQTEDLLNTIIMKEWLLLKKLKTAYEINQKMVCKKDKEKDKDKCCCECFSCECESRDCKTCGNRK